MADQTVQTFLFLESAKSGVIKGETLDSVHGGEIPVEAWSMAITNRDTTSKKDTEKPRADHGCMNLTLKVSRASTFLMKAVVEGSIFKRATISVRKHGSQKTGEASGDFMQIRLHNAMVASYNLGSGKGSDSDTPMEHIELCYDQIEYVYMQQDQKGDLNQTFQHGHDVVKNKGLTDMTLPYKGGGAKGN